MNKQKIGKSKRPLTEEGKAMVAFWRGMKKCQPVKPFVKEKKKNQNNDNK